jgi:uncharacterized cupin superfamily protein
VPDPSIIHCDAVPDRGFALGGLSFERRRLAAAAGAQRIGCSLYRVPGGAQQMPVHVHGDEEEIFFVLSGDGLSWQDESVCAIAGGDVIVQRPRRAAHTFIAGPDGLELLAFASGSDTGITWLPRAEMLWAGPHWVPVDGPRPFEAEAAAGPLTVGEPGPRPANVVAFETIPTTSLAGAGVRALGAAAGAREAGLNHVTLAPGDTGAPPHCHALEEELFFILAGSGRLTLSGDGHQLRAGDVVARPPSSGVAHSLTAGEHGMSYLVDGTRVPGDSVYYPQMGKVRLRGLGITLDVSDDAALGA